MQPSWPREARWSPWDGESRARLLEAIRKGGYPHAELEYLPAEGSLPRIYIRRVRRRMSKTPKPQLKGDSPMVPWSRRALIVAGSCSRLPPSGSIGELVGSEVHGVALDPVNSDL